MVRSMRAVPILTTLLSKRRATESVEALFFSLLELRKNRLAIELRGLRVGTCQMGIRQNIMEAVGSVRRIAWRRTSPRI